MRTLAHEKLNDDKFRVLAVVVLYRIGDKSSIDALNAVAKSAKDEGTRDLASKAIKKILERLNPPNKAPTAGAARRIALPAGITVVLALLAPAMVRRHARARRRKAQG